MNILNKAITGRISRPQKIVIYAPEGFGKTTLASQFPRPLFFDLEGGTAQIDCLRLTTAELPNMASIDAAIEEVARGGKAVCSTLVIDTADWMEETASVELCDQHKVKNLEEVGGGFGKGYTYLTNRMSLTLDKLDAVIRSGIHVVLLAHASIIKFEPPDGVAAFDRYELKLYKDRKNSKGTASLLKEWADALLFGNWRVQIAEKGKGDNVKYKGVGGRDRVLYCTRCSAWDAKNRHGLADEEAWDIATIRKAFANVGVPWEKLEDGAPPDKGPAATPAAPSPIAAAPAPAMVETDGIPGLAPENGGPALVAAYLAPLIPVLQPHEAQVNALLVQRGQIKPGQTFRDISEEYAGRILSNPAGFLNIATAQAA